MARKGTAKADKPKQKCLCGCGVDAYSRGLAPACYYAAYRHVSEGTTTWQALQDAGLALAPFEQNARRSRMSERIAALTKSAS